MSIDRDKIDIIDQAFSSFGAHSFADLGAVSPLEGAYTFHALDKYPVKDAVLVDTNITPNCYRRRKEYPRLRVINGNFGSQAVVDKSVESLQSFWLMCCCTNWRPIGTLLEMLGISE